MSDYSKPYIVFSSRLAGYLLFNKHKLVRVRPDIYDLSKVVYLFENTEDIQKAIDDFNIQMSSN